MAQCILTVDDDAIVIALAKHTLKNKGYEVISAQNGEEALAALKKKIPDLILLDVQMPVMDGYTFIMKKSAVPEYANIPVIVLTSMEKTEPLFKRHGVKAYLLKPLNPESLLNKIQSILPPATT